MVVSVIYLITFIAVPVMALDIPKEYVHFKKGESGVTLNGQLQGEQSIDYVLRAGAGQRMKITLETNNRSNYFNVMAPGEDTAMFIGSTLGDQFEGKLPKDGEYIVRVYLMRNAARRNETAKYTLQVAITGQVKSEVTAAVAAAGTFDRTFELLGIHFRVTCANDSSVNTLRIVPSGLETDNSPIVRSIEGTVTGAEVADINGDGSPEIYVYVTSAGSGSYGSLVAYSANRRKSLSEIYLPPITQDQVASRGYMGHDEFAVLEGVLGHRFPVYRDGDTNAEPTGGMRQLQYKLAPGEASWVLKVDRMIEF
jgi:hypothetical protein